MAASTITGQEILDGIVVRLGGYGNALDTDALLSYANEGKDELWSILKSLNDDYFVQPSTTADVNADSYFGPLSSTVRQYSLPKDFKHIRMIECTTTGYEDLEFEYRSLSDQEFKSRRRDASAGQGGGTTSPGTYLYSILGKNQFLLADYPEAALTLVLWYVRGISDFEPGDNVDEVVLPYTKKIEDFAVKKAMLGLQDQAQFNAWREEWKEDVMMIATSAAPRNNADPIFVQDFLG